MSEDFIKTLRLRIAEILKETETVIDDIENRITEREKELDNKIKEYEGIKIKEKELNDREQKLETKHREITKQIQANREKQLSLDKREEELKGKLDRVQKILN